MPDKTLKPIALQGARICDAFWSKYIGLVADTVLPYQWQLMHDQIEEAEKSGCIRNLEIAAGDAKGTFTGMPFQDSDLAKWMEAAACSLAVRPDAELEAQMEQMIELLGRVQQEDGYFDTYFILNEPDKKWLNLKEGHELYVSGHFIEAAVSYYNATGKKTLLDIVCRNADLICRVLGSGEGQIPGYPGHQEIELALLRLYEITGIEKYKEQARYFLMERGKEPYILDILHERYGRYIFPEFVSFDRTYCQTHLPVTDQDTAEGHAVRALYMYTAMAQLVMLDKDRELLAVCEKIYKNIIEKRMYITGGVGSAGHGERFTCDYDLPNDMAYAESCASIGLAMFCQRMLQATGDAGYADTMEQALYNTVLAGIGMDGKHFFYVNPLEVWPEVCEKNPDHAHVKATRQTWFACACCPPNIARTLASVQSYAAYTQDDCMYFALYISGNWQFSLPGGTVEWKIETRYPFGSEIKLTLESLEPEQPCALALRRPAWCKEVRLTLDGEDILPCAAYRNGFLIIDGPWKKGAEVILSLDMDAHFIQANPNVRADAGKVALVKGPVVYCLEETDNGSNLSALSVNPDKGIRETYDGQLLGGTMVLRASGWRDIQNSWDHALYREWEETREETELVAIPYCYWNNRSAGEMEVWIRTSK